MLNAANTVSEETLMVLDYASPPLAKAMANGQVNTTDEAILSNIRSAIRRHHPQIRPFPPQHDEVCLVGSGPSLTATEGELVDLYMAGAKLITLNGAYRWCLDRNLRPSTQIMLDARPSNARFLEPAVPRCQYVLASQCAPEVWDAVAVRSNVWVFHAAVSEGPIRQLLDAYYLGNWWGVGGGVTVATRALNLLSMVGFRRFHLFGIDCCWMGDGSGSDPRYVHHAFPQKENEADQWFDLTLSIPDRPETKRTFRVSPWHCKQFEDFAQAIRINGDHFLLQVHGDGLLAYAIYIAGGNLASLATEARSVTETAGVAAGAHFNNV